MFVKPTDFIYNLLLIAIFSADISFCMDVRWRLLCLFFWRGCGS